MLNSLFRSGRSYRFFTVFAAVFLLVVITATVVTFILPETFVGVARVLARKTEDSANTTSRNVQSPAPDYDPYFAQTEFGVMQSRVLLSKVVERLDLNEKWGVRFRGGDRLTTQSVFEKCSGAGILPARSGIPAPNVRDFSRGFRRLEARATIFQTGSQETINLLRNSIDLRPIRNTSLIEIRVYSDKPDEAANLANAIAEAYRDYRLERTMEIMEQGMKTLRKELAKGQQELRHAETEVDQLRSELNVSDTDPQSARPTPILNASAVQQNQGDVARLESESARLETQLDKLKSLPRDKLRGVIQSVVETDSMLTTLLTELDVAEQNALKLKSTTTEDHPDYKLAKQQVEALNKKIEDRVDNIMFGLETRLAATKAYIESMTDKLTRAKQSDVENTARTRPYWEAKRKLTELIQFQNVLQMKLASEEADLQLPKLSGVEILDRQTTPNLTPVRPNKPLNIAIGVVLGIVLGLIAAAGSAGISVLSRRNAPPRIAS